MIQLSKQQLIDINFDILSVFDSYCWIAGGCILDAIDGVPSNDIDIFFESEEKKIKAATCFKGAKLKATFPNGYRFLYNRVIYDIIYMGDTPSDVINNFDYTVCGIAIDKHKKIYTVPDFEKHWKTKELHYTGNDQTPGKHAANKSKRLLRYLEKGYKMSDIMLKKWLNQAIDDHHKI